MSTSSSSSTRSARRSSSSRRPPQRTVWTPQHWKAVEVAVAAIEARWQEADAGLWELDNQHWAHSRLTCVSGLRAIAASRARPESGRLERPGRHDPGRRRRATACTPTAAGSGPPTDARVDAALLLPAIRGAVAADDPRTVATLAAVEARAGPGRLRLPVPPGPSTRSRTPKAPSCCAASCWPWPKPSRATTSPPAPCSSGTAAPAGPAACCPRSSTSASANSAATIRRRSCTPCCSSAAPCSRPTAARPERLTVKSAGTSSSRSPPSPSRENHD